MTVAAVLLATAVSFVVASFAGVYRILRGPTMPDRIIALNNVGANTVVIIALLAAAVAEPGALDIALVFALLNFILSLAVSKFSVERGEIL